jgi:hypothetical protein
MALSSTPSRRRLFGACACKLPELWSERLDWQRGWRRAAAKDGPVQTPRERGGGRNGRRRDQNIAAGAMKQSDRNLARRARRPQGVGTDVSKSLFLNKLRVAGGVVLGESRRSPPIGFSVRLGSPGANWRSSGQLPPSLLPAMYAGVPCIPIDAPVGAKGAPKGGPMKPPPSIRDQPRSDW